MIEELGQLKNRIISTLAQNRKFEVLDVNQHSVVIKVRSTGNVRTIPMSQIEESWATLTTTGMLEQVQVMNDVESRSSAYILAMFAQLPGVYKKTKPNRVTYTKPEN